MEARCDRLERLGVDPIGAVRRYHRREDLELAALAGACLAFGNARVARAKAGEVFDRLGPDLARAAADAARAHERLRGFVHRVYRGEDVAGLLVGARRVQLEAGSLEAAFLEALDGAPDFRAGLAGFVARLSRARSPGGGAGGRRGPGHLLPDPAGGSGSKRLLLFLRWVVRPDDGVDLGLWTAVSPALLRVPVDTHLARLSRNLGLTARRSLDFRTTEELTAALRRLDPEDPVRFDFPLCHLGMLQRCPSRRDPVRCEGCGVMPVCRHWAPRAPARRSSPGAGR